MNNMETKSIILIVPNTYNTTPFVNGLKPIEVIEILKYGEELYKSHEKMIRNKTSKKEIRTLMDEKIQLNAQLDTEKQNIIDKKQFYFKEIKEKENNQREKIRQMNEENNQTINTVKKQYEYRNDELKKQYECINYELKKQLDNIENKVRNECSSWSDEIITIFKKRISSLEKEKEKQEVSKKKEIFEFKEEYKKDYISQNNKIIPFLKERISSLEREKEKQKVDENNELIKKLNILTENVTYTSNTDKGVKGETIVQNILKKKYEGSEIIDTSNISSSGDIKFNYKDLRCLIEIKNVKIIQTERDINKFNRDIREQKKDINCALFISLESVCIPNKDSFHYERYQGLPVYYIAQNPIDLSIEHAITDLMRRVKEKREEREEEIHVSNITNGLKGETRKTFGKDLYVWKQKRKLNDELIKQHTNILKKLKVEEEKINKKIDEVNNYFDKYADSKWNL